MKKLLLSIITSFFFFVLNAQINYQYHYSIGGQFGGSSATLDITYYNNDNVIISGILFPVGPANVSDTNSNNTAITSQGSHDGFVV